LLESDTEVVSGLVNATVHERGEDVRCFLSQDAPDSAAEHVAMLALGDTGPMPAEEDLVGTVVHWVLVSLKEHNLVSGSGQQQRGH
jgi:hypothetical protein